MAELQAVIFIINFVVLFAGLAVLAALAWALVGCRPR